jgi:NAD(P)H-binding
MAGDALKMATVKCALTGVDAIIQSLGVSAGPEIILKPTRLFSKATRVLVTAMEEAQVKRLICVTGFGTGDSLGRGGFLCSAALTQRGAAGSRGMPQDRLNTANPAKSFPASSIHPCYLDCSQKHGSRFAARRASNAIVPFTSDDRR